MTHAIPRSQHVHELFEQYAERVTRFARRSLPASEADDIVQDVFYRLLRAHDLESRDITVSYLFKIADNLIKRRSRQRARQAEMMRALHRRRHVALGMSTATDTDQFDIRTAMERLPAHEYDALLLIVAQGLAYDSVARTLGVPVTTVNNWKHRGLTRLAGAMRREPGRSAPRTPVP